MQSETTPEMTAAIVAVTRVLRGTGAETTTVPTSPWAIAMRRPDLDSDELRALARRARGR